MVQIRKITKTEMYALYEEEVLIDVINMHDRIYAKSTKGFAEDTDLYEIVWCDT